MATQANEGGTGGKFRRRPFRRAAPTPYDRPPTALRGVRRGGHAAEGGGWISKLVDPASRLIVNRASKLLSSVFGNRLTSPTRNSGASSSGPSSTSFAFGLSSGANTSPFTGASSSSSSSTPFTVGSSSGSSSSPFTMGSSSASSSTAFAFGSSSGSSSTPFVFGSSPGSVFSTSSSPAPAFGSQKPAFGFGSGSLGNGQMNVEDGMTDVTNNAQTPLVPTFGQSANPPAAPSFVFGAPSAQPVASPAFQFGGLQNPSVPQNPSPFQPAGTTYFNLGGSFSSDSGGGNKSARKFVKVKRRSRNK